MQAFKKIVISILIWESRIIIAKYKPFVIAVTGSVGKTSTKDAIYSVIKHASRYTRKSEKSFNSEIGLPLTIIGVPNAWKDIGGWFRNILQGLELIMWRVEYPDCLVLEIGADHPGDIKRVTKWLHPDIVVMTRVSDTPVHVEFFPSPEDVFKEKAYLAQAVKNDGTLVLLADDAKVMSLGNGKVISYGTVEKADVRGTDIDFNYTENGSLAGISFKLSMDGNTETIKLNGVLGSTYTYPLLAAVAVGKAKGMALSRIIDGINEYEAPRGRMNIIAGINGSTLIDDTYNSSPDAALSALEALNRAKTSGRKIVAFGDMMELGKYAADEHRKVGLSVANVANILVTVGQRSKMSLVEGAVTGGMKQENIHCFDSSVDAGKYLSSIVMAGDMILVKGSQSTRMERVSAALLRESMRAGELLVRQEKEWLEKR
ncbi:MAG: Mur ligase family protein [Candidatus Taylorbacteria bacterium]